MANVTGTFSGTGQSATFAPSVSNRSTLGGGFAIVLTGTGVGTVVLECSHDNAVTWCGVYAAGTQLYSYSYSGSNILDSATAPRPGLLFRLNCTALTSGSIAYELSQ